MKKAKIKKKIFRRPVNYKPSPFTNNFIIGKSDFAHIMHFD